MQRHDAILSVIGSITGGENGAEKQVVGILVDRHRAATTGMAKPRRGSVDLSGEGHRIRSRIIIDLLIGGIDERDILGSGRQFDHRDRSLAALNHTIGANAGLLVDFDIEHLSRSGGNDPTDRGHAVTGVLVASNIGGRLRTRDWDSVERKQLVILGPGSIVRFLNAGIGENKIEPGLVESDVTAGCAERKGGSEAGVGIDGVVGHVNEVRGVHPGLVGGTLEVEVVPGILELEKLNGGKPGSAPRQVGIPVVIRTPGLES